MVPVFHWSCPCVLSEKHQQSYIVVPVFHWSCPSVLSEKHQQSQWYQCFTDLVLVFYLKNTSNHSGTSVSLILSFCFIWKTSAITVVPVFHWSCPSVLSEKHQQSQWYQCFTDLVLVFYLKNTSNHSDTNVSLILSLCFIWKTPAIIYSGTTVFHWSCPSVLSEKHQQSYIVVPQCFTDLVLVFYLKNTSNHI